LVILCYKHCAPKQVREKALSFCQRTEKSS
jgi:hypothetical protein